MCDRSRSSVFVFNGKKRVGIQIGLRLLVQNDKRVLLGEMQEYEPLCRECYKKAIEESGARS